MNRLDSCFPPIITHSGCVTLCLLSTVTYNRHLFTNLDCFELRTWFLASSLMAFDARTHARRRFGEEYCFREKNVSADLAK